MDTNKEINIAPQINLWKKHANSIKKCNINTIKDLVIHLRQMAKKDVSIKGITSFDAAEMLIDIGMYPLQSGFIFRDDVQKHFFGKPDEINFDNILLLLDKIFNNKEMDEKTKSYIKKIIDMGRSRKIKDPFEEEILLIEHPITSFAFKENIFEEIGRILKLDEEAVAKLKQHYFSRDQFINSSITDIQFDTGIDESKINIIKNGLSLASKLQISNSLACAFAYTSLNTIDIVRMNTEELDEKIKQSSIYVPQSERTNNHLQRVIDSAKKSIPDIAYYYDSISSLDLPPEIISILKKENVQSFRDLRKNGLINQIINSGQLNNNIAVRLRSFNKLEKISNYNFKLADSLILNKIFSAYKLSRIPRNDFINKYNKIANKDELSNVHKRAIETTSKNFGVAIWAFLISKKFNVDRVLPAHVDNQKYAGKILKAGE